VDLTRSIAAALPHPAARVAVVPVESGNDGLLSPAERKRAMGFRFPRRRADWIAGRAAARLALREIGGSEAGGFSVETGPNGEPIVSGASFGVSISHAGGIAAAVAFPSERPIGIDLEPVTAIDPGLATLACNDREQEWLADNESLLRIWTAKEAAVKLTGTGLRVALQQVRIESADPELTELAVGLPASVDGRKTECRVRVISLSHWVAALAWFPKGSQ